MPYSHLNDYPADIRERACRVRLACFDVDGTLTDGRLTFDSEGREAKTFHVHDGMGLVMLRQAGIGVALVTARASSVVERRAAELGIQAYTAIADKLACVRELAAAHNVALDEVAFMGDDLPDLRVMPHVGFSIAPANAHRWVSERVHWRSTRPGGDGAVREVCDLLLAAQGHAERLLAQALPTGVQA